jgi:pimeloyl-ACP methyl ester carboxylesterase
MANFVLVHGAWHGGWCWNKIVARLEARGHKVAAPDMIGHGIDRTPPDQTTLAGIVDGIVAVVNAMEGKVVLVGHSYGGMIITQVGERIPEKIQRLVYLTAIIAPGGKSVLDMNTPDPESVLGEGVVFSADGKTAFAAPGIVRDAFYAQCSDEDVALANLLLVPEGVAGLATPSIATAERWGRLPHAYIECIRDRAIGITRQRQFAGLLNKPELRSIDTDHSPFFSRPDELTKHLVELI